MMTLVCKKCGSNSYVKNGFIRGKQRYKCNNLECGCNFTDTPPRGKPESLKSLVSLLYAVGGVSLNGLSRIFGVSDVSIGRWVKASADKIPEPEIPAETKIVILDEMWHFIEKKLKNYGSGGQFAVSLAEPLGGCWVIVVKKLVGNSLIK
jgi:transposase